MTKEYFEHSTTVSSMLKYTKKQLNRPEGHNNTTTTKSSGLLPNEYSLISNNTQELQTTTLATNNVSIVNDRHYQHEHDTIKAIGITPDSSCVIL